MEKALLFVIGMAFGGWLILASTASDRNVYGNYRATIQDCQQSLPRDQSCTVEMIGVVVKNKK